MEWVLACSQLAYCLKFRNSGFGINCVCRHRAIIAIQGPKCAPSIFFSPSATLQIPRSGRFAVTIRRPQYHWLNMARRFHIAAYDIADPRRLRQSLRVAKEFATGGQRSVFECPLTPAEHDEFTQRISEILDMEEDRFCLLRLEPKARVRTLGIAVPLSNPNYFYAG